MSTAGRKNRVSIACVPCRRKKCRCDGQKPACAVCEKEGKSCEYAHHLEKRKPPTKCYIHALHSRISHLELQLAQIQENRDPRAPSTTLDSNLLRPAAMEDLAPSTPNPNSSGAYGHLEKFGGSLDTQESQEQREYFSADMLLPQDYPFLLEPEIQEELLTEFWTWQSTWPLLVHQPLFLKDLSEHGAVCYSTPAVLCALLALAAQYADTTSMHYRFPTFDKKASVNVLVQHAKSLVLGQIERPSLSLAMASCLLSMREISVDNMAAASQYIGIAVRHILALGPCIENVGNPSTTSSSMEIGQARSMAKLGIWMVEKQLTQAMGQPSTIQESDCWPVSLPIVPSIEYGLWPPSSDNLAPQIMSSCMSNFQYTGELLRMVSPILDTIYAQRGPLSFEQKEDQATKAHVAMSEFYNNLPSSLRLPPSITTLLPPHVYQFNLQYHSLKIMLHRPFIRSAPSMEALQDLQSPKALHLQSATFSAIRITYIVKSFERFFSLNRLSPFTVTSLNMSSLIHLFNATSKDSTLSQRSKHLHEKNMGALHHMSATTKTCDREIRTLQSIARDWGVPTDFLYEDSVTRGHHVESSQRIESQFTDTGQAVDFQSGQFQLPFVPELPASETANDITPVDSFNWFELPLNDQLLDDGEFFGNLCAQDEWKYGCLEI